MIIYDKKLCGKHVSFEDTIQIMKDLIEQNYEIFDIKNSEYKNKRRKWLESHCDSYPNGWDNEHRIQIFVLEGSPPKGIILINYALKKIIGFDVNFKKIKEYEYL